MPCFKVGFFLIQVLRHCVLRCWNMVFTFVQVPKIHFLFSHLFWFAFQFCLFVASSFLIVCLVFSLMVVLLACCFACVFQSFYFVCIFCFYFLLVLFNLFCLFSLLVVLHASFFSFSFLCLLVELLKCFDHFFPPWHVFVTCFKACKFLLSWF